MAHPHLEGLIRNVIVDMRQPENSGQFGPWQITAANIKDWADQLEAATAAPAEGVDPLDKIEFALRDAGFDYDEAFRIAHMATIPEVCKFYDEFRSTPADAVREAPTELDRIIAEMKECGDYVPADNVNDWADRLTALQAATGGGK